MLESDVNDEDRKEGEEKEKRQEEKERGKREETEIERALPCYKCSMCGYLCGSDSPLHHLRSLT